MTCLSCRGANPEGARFCLNCGAPLGAPLTVDGERKVATILFADVVGSTAMAERVDPEEWAEVMNGAIAFMNAAVTRYGGTVGRIMGDAILALFGAPVAHEDDAERAVRAGLDIVAAAAQYAEGLRRRHALDFAVRVGINTGLSVLTTVGDAAKAEYTAMGDAANLAARLQSLARPGAVLIGSETHALVKHLFDVRPRGLEAVKGRQEPVATYEVLGVAAAAGAARGLDGVRSPLVGRAKELELLRQRVGALAGGQGGVVSLVGEAGLGKSRLIAELRRAAEGREVRWLEGRGLSYAQTVPYYPWRQVLLASLDAGEGDTPTELRTKLAATVGAHGPEDRIDDELAFLEALLTVETEATMATVARFDGKHLARQIGDAVIAYLSGLASTRPTVVVLEDLHWADPASLEVLVAAAARVAAQPLLLLAALRPDRQAPSRDLPARLARAAGEAALELNIAPLDDEGARQLLTNLLDVKDLPPATRERILARADGNPFYLEEVLRSLIDAGHIVREEGGWRATREIGSVPIPDSLSAVLGARIDRLAVPARQVAQTASVIGRNFQSRVLASVLDADRPGHEAIDLAPQLDTLTQEDLVREESREPELAYMFKHALTQEAAYERLLLRRRRELHRRVGQVLERSQGDRPDDIAPVLAHHFRLAEAWPAAAHYAAVAAARARRLYALPEALALYEEALEAHDRDPGAGDGPAPERDAGYVDTVLGWADTLVAMRGHERSETRERIHERLDDAVRRARAMADGQWLVRALVAQGNVLSLSGYPGTGFPLLAEAHDLARQLGDDKLFLLPFWAATEKMIDEAPRAAADQFRSVIELAHRVNNHGIEAHALGSRAVALARLGEFEEALDAVETALQVVTRSDSTIKEADVTMLAGATFMDIGWLDLALDYAGDGTDLALSVNGLECACNGLYLRGLGRMEELRPGLALGDFDHALQVGEGTAYEDWLHNVRAARATARFRSGDVVALPEIEAELRNARVLNDGYGAATAALALGRALLLADRAEEAEAHVRQALEWYRERGMRPYVQRSVHVLARVLTALGRTEDARLALEEEAAIEASLAFDADRARAVRARARAYLEAARAARAAARSAEADGKRADVWAGATRSGRDEVSTRSDAGT